ncbi:cobyric acid synthase [Salinibius halmophilus]|uniref:cobyric acid synthase n=1 Tax=Salinibius halmophilus TaxID=1853216 RepID=UPI0018F3B56A|nr:cobyric acid synthase [Salinibius halmophilus]
MRPIMLQGCTSDAGKSLLAAGLCRALVNRGFQVAPFKAQNMSNFAAITPDGGEIGRAQWLQAKACRLAPHTDMNPVLIKPESDMRSQVIVNGEVDHEVTKLPWMQRKQRLWPHVESALARLQSKYDVVVIEGAGSPAEVNLRAGDIVNMAVALHCNARVQLIADIHRGGAYAHLLGTWHCLSASEQNLVQGFVLNMFRGDASLLAPADEWILQQTGIAVSGCIPYWPHRLPDEDSWRHQSSFIQGQTNIAVVVYPYASNLDELDVLLQEEGVNLVPIRHGQSLVGFDAVILPGSKNSLASLAWLHEQGLAAQIPKVAHRFGICGGLQILGESLAAEDNSQQAQGLGLLPLTTSMQANKVTQLTTVKTEFDVSVTGYEIHHGKTSGKAEKHLDDELGWRQGQTIGVYLHDIFTNDDYRQWWLEQLGWRGQVRPWQQRIDQELDRLADMLERTGWVDNVVKQEG